MREERWIQFTLDWIIQMDRLYTIKNYMGSIFYRTHVSLGSDLWVRLSETERPCADLTDVSLADEDTNSILTDNANRAIQGNIAMQVT